MGRGEGDSFTSLLDLAGVIEDDTIAEDDTVGDNSDLSAGRCLPHLPQMEEIKQKFQ